MSILLSSALFGNSALAAEKAPTWQSLKTPRQSQMEIQWLAPSSPTAPVLVVAPGQSCNARRPLFEALGQAAQNQGVGLLRLEWSYCSLDKDKRKPSTELQGEKEDIQSALNWLKQTGVKNPVLLAGKSLGSLVSYSVFQNQPELKGLALLTPVCSYNEDEKGQLLNPPINMLEKHYPGLAQIQRPLLVSLGNDDSLCHLPYLYTVLQNAGAGPNQQLQVWGGGHSLGIALSADKMDEVASERNLNAFAQGVMNWAWLVGK
jgi:predicted alpha/beta-hydrolase family hydrolase